MVVQTCWLCWALVQAAGGPKHVVDLTNEPDSDPDEVQIVGERRGARGAFPMRVPMAMMHRSRPHPLHQHNQQAQQAQKPQAQLPSWKEPPRPAPPSPEKGYKCAICLEKMEDMSSTSCGWVLATL